MFFDFTSNFALFKYDNDRFISEIANIELAKLQSIKKYVINDNVKRFEIKWLEEVHKTITIRENRIANLFIFTKEKTLFYAGFDEEFITKTLKKFFRDVTFMKVDFFNYFQHLFIRDEEEKFQMNGFQIEVNASANENINKSEYDKQTLCSLLNNKPIIELYMTWREHKVPFIISNESHVLVYDTFDDIDLLYKLMEELIK